MRDLMMTFADLGLLAPLPDTLRSRGLVAPTPVQQATIPSVLAGRDVRVRAQTGSGKTAAFVLPLLQRLGMAAERAPANSATALVLVPTRELAAQVAEVCHEFAAGLSLRIAMVTGGVSINPQMMSLRGGVDVLVATPGRLLDLVAQRALTLSRVSVLVLDEADRLLDLGFAEEVGRILQALPSQRQNLLLSATCPDGVADLAAGLLRDPVLIDTSDADDATPDILERCIEVDPGMRRALLCHLIRSEGWARVLVFVASSRAAVNLAGKLEKHGLAAAAFHGELAQGARTRLLAEFKAGRLQVLVATDLAARGIDIDRLPVVVNADLPRSTADYTHRIGRTGRAGQAGLAVSFVDAGSEGHFRLIEKRQGRRVPRERIPGFEPVAVPAGVPVPDGNGGIKGRRKSKKDKLREAAARSED